MFVPAVSSHPLQLTTRSMIMYAGQGAYNLASEHGFDLIGKPFAAADRSIKNYFHSYNRKN